jgi:predicted GTPase
LIRMTDEFSNEVMATAAAAGASVATFVADVTQTPSLAPATISAMAASIDNQATAIAQAYTNGIARRKESDAAIQAAQKVIANAQTKVSQAVLNDVVNKAQDAESSTTAEHAQIVALASGVPSA